MRVLISYRAIPESPGWATGDFLASAFESLGHKVSKYAKVYNQDKWLENPQDLLKQQYDLYIQMECGDGDELYSELINVKAQKKASWWFDISLYPERWMRETSYYGPDVNFVANKNFLTGWKDNCYYLPYAASADKHYRTIVNKTVDFLIIGSDRIERRALYRNISLSCPTAKVEYRNDLFREQYVDALSSARFVINDIAGGGRELIPMRPFECLISGSELITPQDDGCKGLGLPCYEYYSSKNLTELCHNLLSVKSQDHRDFMLQNHTYEVRVKQILEAVNRV